LNAPGVALTVPIMALMQIAEPLLYVTQSPFVGTIAFRPSHVRQNTGPAFTVG
jgi:hypothetical protein